MYLCHLTVPLLLLSVASTNAREPSTQVGINGDRFTINGQPTCKGRVWQGERNRGAAPQCPDGLCDV